LFSKMREVVEKFGYEEYDAPILEPIDLYLAKSGEEIVNEQTYVFEDRGGRQVVIRPEMTPTVSRMVAGRRQELAYPVRWYSIPNLWRYERPQKGRLREHWQLNVDLFGISELSGDHEIILLADQILKAFGAKSSMYKIRISSRLLITYLINNYLGLDPARTLALMKLIDKMDKMEYDKFVIQIDGLVTLNERDNDLPNKILDLLKIKKLEDLPVEVRVHPAVTRLEELIKLLESSKVNNVEFDITLMRGFDYYTDVVFEVFDTNPENNRSMFGGGRYDGLVGLFGVEPVPTVGFGLGDVTLKDFLEAHELLPELSSEVDLIVIIVGDVYAKAQPAIKELREMKVNVYVDSTDAKLDKKMKNASKMGVKYVLFIGNEELSTEQFKIRNMRTALEETHGLQRIVSIVKDFRDI
jgi:histidyl-tRNA synthetase